jgi:Predicted ATPase of the ABC class
VYNKVRGDGRELVVTEQRTWKVRAEDGRCTHKVDISPFINNLPSIGGGGANGHAAKGTAKDTRAFSSQDASGSTSQAANIAEGLEAGATTLLLDEDTCATNFMIRDAKMQALVAKHKEPITPFLHKIRSLLSFPDNLSTVRASRNVSTILVV